VIDINLATVRQLRAAGHTAVYGDVLRMETLSEAGIATAGSLVLSADIEEAAEVVRQARLVNPEIRVLARCAHLRMAPAIRRAGANIVVTGEAEVGVALAEAVAVGDEMPPDAAKEYRQSVRSRLYDLPKSE
jgi:CPA2 family monovalent cation:H+ antiporter-2